MHGVYNVKFLSTYYKNFIHKVNTSS
jgi:hypothetical protein